MTDAIIIFKVKCIQRLGYVDLLNIISINVYQSVFPEKKLFENIRKKAGFGVITLQYLAFQAMLKFR